MKQRGQSSIEQLFIELHVVRVFLTRVLFRLDLLIRLVNAAKR